MFIGDAFLLGLGLVELLEYYISSEPKFGVAMFGAENNFSVEQFVPKFMLGFVFLAIWFWCRKNPWCQRYHDSVTDIDDHPTF